MTSADSDNPSLSAKSAGGTSAARFASAALRAGSTRGSPTAARRSRKRSLDRGPFIPGAHARGRERALLVTAAADTQVPTHGLRKNSGGTAGAGGTSPPPTQQFGAASGIAVIGAIFYSAL